MGMPSVVAEEGEGLVVVGGVDDEAELANGHGREPYDRDVTDDLWQIDHLDLDGYLDRIGVARGGAEPRAARPRARSAPAHVHVRQHRRAARAASRRRRWPPSRRSSSGAAVAATASSTRRVLAAALQRLGFDLRRQLGRVGDPMRSGRTHFVVIVRLDGEELLCDPGFGLSILRPHPLRDGAEERPPGSAASASTRSTAAGPCPGGTRAGGSSSTRPTTCRSFPTTS